MATGILTIDLDAIAANWRALDAMTACETGAVVKADAYGLGAGAVAARLAREGARRFFVAVAEEGAAVRRAVGAEAEIFVFSGLCRGDAPLVLEHGLIPLLNSPEQAAAFLDTGLPYGIQLDSGMNRLGMEPADFAALRDSLQARPPALAISHLACADEPDHPMNRAQLACFREMTEGLGAPRSLAATGGILLGPDYHFDLTRPGIGLYGGAPYTEARPVVRLELPVIQTRRVEPGETVGYGCAWEAPRPARIATLAAGYADGLHRALGNGGLRLWAGETPCPLVGRVSMDLLTVDVSHLPEVSERLALLCPQQGIDAVATAVGTIGYEILTSLGRRYERHYKGAPC